MGSVVACILSSNVVLTNHHGRLALSLCVYVMRGMSSCTTTWATTHKQSKTTRWRCSIDLGFNTPSTIEVRLEILARVILNDAPMAAS